MKTFILTTLVSGYLLILVLPLSYVHGAVGGEKVTAKGLSSFALVGGCGGVQIENGVILSSAHCIKDHNTVTTVEDFNEYTSDHRNIFLLDQQQKRLSVTSHSQFPPIVKKMITGNTVSDLALIFFDYKSVPRDGLSHIDFVALKDQEHFDQIWLYGKGGIKRELFAPVHLRKIRLKHGTRNPRDDLSLNLLSLRFLNNLLFATFCDYLHMRCAKTFYREEQDGICQGDSGSPVIASDFHTPNKHYVVGIASAIPKWGRWSHSKNQQPPEYADSSQTIDSCSSVFLYHFLSHETLDWIAKEVTTFQQLYQELGTALFRMSYEMNHQTDHAINLTTTITKSH
ncbi:MAG: trypsin-like serine protease [Proteobacteria bacterium]|nr:trypsin-like serine protease [Pseudomonadota bacterium]